MEPRRALPRYRRLKSGEITFGKIAVPCTVRNLSDNGASLEFQSTWGLPARFDLKVGHDLTRRCQAAWVGGTSMGVCFI